MSNVMKKSFPDELINLVKQGDDKKVLSIVRNDEILFKLVDSDGVHLLNLAAKYNNWSLIDSLTNLGCELDIEDSSGTTPLITALLNDSFKAARVLFNKHVERYDSDSLSHAQAMQHVVAEIYSKLQSEKRSSENIGSLLARIRACLCSVVSLNDLDVTKAYLQSFKSQNMIHHESTLFEDVMPKLDMQHLVTILNEGSAIKYKIMGRLCCYIVHHIFKYQRTKAGREFLKKIFSWDYFDQENFRWLEKALMKSKKKNIKIFLQYNFHIMVKEKSGRDLLACLFGNNSLKIGSMLKYIQIDVNGRGYNGNTPLMFAVENSVLRNIKYLLDRGADPNVSNDINNRPLDVAYSLEILKLLLIEGADCLLDCEYPFESMFSTGLNGGDTSDDDDGDDNGSTPSNNNDYYKLATCQFAIYEVLSMSTDKHIECSVLFRPRGRRFYKECIEQLIQLKSNKIHGSITMLTILTERPIKIARYVSDEDLQTITSFVKSSKKTLYTYYRQALKKHAKDISRINKCRNNAMQVISEFSGIQDSHHLVIYKIVNYLDFRDLLKFEGFNE